jgi:hypothetical protein
MITYIIYTNKDKTEAGLTTLDLWKNDTCNKFFVDTSGQKMSKLKSFEANNWDEAKLIYDVLLHKEQTKYSWPNILYVVYIVLFFSFVIYYHLLK